MKQIFLHLAFLFFFGVASANDETLTLPVRFHITQGATMTVKGQVMEVWVKPPDITGPVLAEVNRIWAPANIQFSPEQVSEEALLKPENFEELVAVFQNTSREAEKTGDIDRRVPSARSLFDPEHRLPRALNVYLLPYIGLTLQGFARLEGTLAVVGVWTDKASRGKNPPVRALLVEAEPMVVGSLARTIAHELGHNLGLLHPDRGGVAWVGRLMGGAKEGYALAPEEIAKARAVARKLLAR